MQQHNSSKKSDSQQLSFQRGANRNQPRGVQSVHEDANKVCNNTEDSIEKSMVVVGQIGRPQGIQGGMRLNSYTQPIENILNYQPWFIQKKNSQTWEEIEYSKVEHHSKGLVIFLKGISDRNTVSLYTQADVAVLHEQLPALSEDEYYWSDLEGLNVQTQQGVSLGRVDHLFETGSNDVLIVKGEKEHAIPYLMGNTVLKIDLDNKTIIVDWDPDF